MSIFTPKRLAANDGFGEKLRQARLFKNLRLEDIAKKINISAKYLNALEEENFDNLPSGLYRKNFLREYANYLGLDNLELIKQLEVNSENNSSVNPFSKKILKKSKFLVFPKIIRNALLFLSVLICFLYLIFYFQRIISAPELTIVYPEKNLLIKETSIEIKGQTEKEAEIKINGELVLNNNNGIFLQAVNLKKGLNTITISAKKKYSKESIVTRQILVE
ncbi:MAG: helix-turn-helix domain-containing protein [Patescibacteria group bacterium]